MSGEVLTTTSQQLLLYSSVLGTKVQLSCASEDALRVTLESRPPSSMPRDVLAAAPVRDGRIQPNVFVFYESVNELLPVRSDRLMARALALVIVHECFHYIQQDRGHATRGIRAEAFTGQDLERGAQWWTKHTTLEAATGQ